MKLISSIAYFEKPDVAKDGGAAFWIGPLPPLSHPTHKSDGQEKEAEADLEAIEKPKRKAQAVTVFGRKSGDATVNRSQVRRQLFSN
ncbi:hypothetical protein AAFF_G00401450 [Aldrovandia affinis]|uniref:Uncharacterized protein n=1 Tax=Aldrovandia affinis TaxID=143900 RepID=A0AAD7WK93_9TELE|nr:hypothetical protein AAFF_G00401450 [Aldrovandia affinis]